MRERPWSPASDAPDGIMVETKIDDAHGVRNVQRMMRRGNLWWLADGSMYAYYAPTHFRSIQKQDNEDAG